MNAVVFQPSKEGFVARLGAVEIEISRGGRFFTLIEFMMEDFYPCEDTGECPCGKDVATADQDCFDTCSARTSEESFAYHLSRDAESFNDIETMVKAWFSTGTEGLGHQQEWHADAQKFLAPWSIEGATQ